MWGTVLKRDLLGETREEDKIRSKEQLQEYLKSEIKKQGEHVVIKNLDVSLVEDLSELFYEIAEGVRTLDLSGWKTSNANDMSYMFFQCDNLESIDVSACDTSNVTYMTWMFKWCESLASLDLSGWDTSNVRGMNGMFAYCKNLKSLDLSGWDTSNAKDMGKMFYECSAPYRVVYDNR